MFDNATAQELMEQNEIAFLHADICLGSPESYSLAEKAQICEGMEATNKAIEEAMRKDFASMPPTMQSAMLDMLCGSDCMTAEWWKELLLGEMPSSVDAMLCEAQ